MFPTETYPSPDRTKAFDVPVTELPTTLTPDDAPSTITPEDEALMMFPETEAPEVDAEMRIPLVTECSEFPEIETTLDGPAIIAVVPAVERTELPEIDTFEERPVDTAFRTVSYLFPVTTRSSTS